LREVVADEVSVDGAIHDHVGDVDIPRAQFASHALRQCADPVFGSGECGKAGGATQAGGGTGKQDGPAITGDHALGHFPGVEEA